MITIKDYETIKRSMRLAIHEKLAISLNDIYDATSINGPDIYKIINENEAVSYDLNDCFIIYELIEDTDDKNTVMQSDDSMLTIQSYKIIFKIYGNNSHNIAQKLIMLFKSNNVSIELYQKGIFLNGVEFPISKNEFINRTVWPRCDVTINLTVQYEDKNIVGSSYDADYINNIIINKK